MNPLRFATPGQLVICLVLFFLPWIEIQCPVPDLGALAAPEPRAKSSNRPVGWTPLISQSGFQAATGKYTVLDATMSSMMDIAKVAGKAEGGKGPNDAKMDQLFQEKPAPLLFLVPAAALVGILVGVVVPSGPNRKAILVLCCLLVLTAAGGQAAFGFPMKAAATEELKKEREKQAKLGGGMANADRDDFEFRANYKVSFYLTLLLAAGGLVTAAAEPPARPPKKRRRRDDEDEDEDEEVEEARPDEEPEKPRRRDRGRRPPRDDPE